MHAFLLNASAARLRANRIPGSHRTEHFVKEGWKHAREDTTLDRTALVDRQRAQERTGDVQGVLEVVPHVRRPGRRRAEQPLVLRRHQVVRGCLAPAVRTARQRLTPSNTPPDCVNHQR